MRRSRGFVLVLLLATFAALSLLAAAPAPSVHAQPSPTVTCAELRELGLEVALTDRDLTGGDETGFCLVARPEDDTFIGYLPNVVSLDEFRAAKQRHARAMDRGGFDVCRVGVWRPLNREDGPRIVPPAADQLDGPTACVPRVVARDTAAARWIGPVQEALGPMVERTTADLGVTVTRPLTIDLYAGTESFIAAAQSAARAAGRPLTTEDARRVAEDGRSLTMLTPARGVFVLINLTRSPDPDTLRRRLAHEYTHFVQSAAGGTLDAYPMWFLEGSAEFQTERLAGADRDRRADAARRERDGGAPRLTDLATPDAWAAAETALGSDAVYSRAYSAVAFIAERWGYTATVTLLNAASDTDATRFNRTLREVTGMDLDGLDRALGAWLQGLRGNVTFYNDSPLGWLLMFPGGKTVEVPACATCTFRRAADTCREDGRPAARVELPAGDHDVTLIIPNDRVHFPDSALRLHIDAATSVTRCLILRTS